jgi:hypothetical protein
MRTDSFCHHTMQFAFAYVELTSLDAMGVLNFLEKYCWGERIEDGLILIMHLVYEHDYNLL